MHRRTPLSSCKHSEQIACDYVSRDRDIAKMARQSPVLKVRSAVLFNQDQPLGSAQLIGVVYHCYIWL